MNDRLIYKEVYARPLKRLALLLLCLLTCTLFVTAGGKQQPVQSARRQISALEQQKLNYFFYEGLALKAAEKYDAAYEMFNHCYQIDSTASAVLFELSSFYLQLEQPEKAAHMMRKAVENDPLNFTYKLILASLRLNLGMYGEAVESYEELANKHPEKVELKYYLAEALTQEGELGKAIDMFNELEEAIGMSEPLSMQKYRLYTTLEKPEKAFDELKKLAAKYPENARYPILIGDLYLEKKNTQQALAHYQKAHAIDSGNPFYTISMANYYEVVGNTVAAEEQIRSALVNDDLDVEIKVGVLSRYIQQLMQTRNDTEGANALFQTLLEQHPEDIELKLMYGGLLLSQEHTNEARFQFQLATEMEPSNQKAWQQLLSLALQTQDLNELMAICAKCQTLFPEASEYYFYQGVGYSQLEKYTEALETYEAGLQIIPNDNQSLKSDFYGQIGDLYFQMKNSDKAFEAYDQALLYNDQNIVILNNYSYFLSLEKRDLDKAERMSAQCVKLEPENSTYLDTYAWIYFVKGNYLLAKIYIEKAIEKDATKNPELFDHYGDILYLNGDTNGAVKQWERAKELGKKSNTLNRKIAEKVYIEHTGND